MKKVGFFGGSFDPPHIGHIIPLIETKKLLELDKIFFIPACISPNKNTYTFADKEIRIQMLKSIIEEFDFFDIEYFEINKKGISYSIDTVKYINKKYRNYETYLIIGEDNFQSFNKWKDYKQIINLIKIIVLKRYTNITEITSDIEQSSFIRLQTPIIEISSTMVRDWIKKDLPYQYLIPYSIYKIIKKKKIYI